jgi:hypothetical protein
MTLAVWYMAAPLRPTPEQVAALYAVDPTASALKDNLARAMRWLSWLRRTFPGVTFIAPWIAAVLVGADDSDPRQREAGLVDADAVVPLCTGVVLVGGRVSSGMARERGKARRDVDLIRLGVEPPTEIEEWDVEVIRRTLIGGGG